MPETLINPPWYRKMLTWISTPSQSRKIAIYAALGLALLALVLFAFDRIGGYWSSRKIDDLKEQANAKIEEANTIKKEIANLEVKKEILITEANVLIQDVKEAEANTDEKERNLNAITPATNVTGEELERKLRGL